jgi:hypothetical protein
MDIGESVVFVNDVEGIEAGRHGRVMGLCDDTVMVGCRMRERLHLVLVHAWDVLPEPMWRRLLRRRRIAQWETHGCQIGMSKREGELSKITNCDLKQEGSLGCQNGTSREVSQNVIPSEQQGIS